MCSSLWDGVVCCLGLVDTLYNRLNLNITIVWETSYIVYVFTLKFLHSKKKITSLNNLYKSVFDLLKNVVPWTGLIYNKIYENTTTSVLFTALQVFYGTCNWLDKSLSMHVWSCLLISSWVISKKGSNFSYNFYTVFWVNSFHNDT